MKDGTALKGVYVNASVPIVLYAFSLYPYASDGYLAIPRKLLSKNYIVPSFSVFKHRSVSKSVIGIVSTANVTTHVQIKLNLRNDTTLSFNSVEYNNTDIVSVNLTELETLQISHDFDLSGSIITSSHPVGVVSGNICNSITHYYCNLFTEMILPTNQLDKTFIVPTIEGRHSRVVRIWSLTRHNYKYLL
ncbi:unnamed protein product [Mytilus edulis]|uniref:IgGFc-binding protein N-terminal domain-containing protein n=1 Tax=Mytilus edulis TaxID=6550 RepID=A0A8S3UW82_MYTED|nr:unnamed protein product [Mytilus edulis]